MPKATLPEHQGQRGMSSGCCGAGRPAVAGGEDVLWRRRSSEGARAGAAQAVGARVRGFEAIQSVASEQYMKSPGNYKQWLPSNIGSGSVAVHAVGLGKYMQWL